MNETAKLEVLLGAGGEVRLGRRDVQEMLQKLRARGAGGAAADRLASKLGEADEVVLPQGEAQELLEELRASGRRWVFGSEAPRARPERAPEPDRKHEAEPDRPSRRRFWRR
jgi:hypothetical protein